MTDVHKCTTSVTRYIFQRLHDGLAKCICPSGMHFVFVFELLMSCVSASNTGLDTLVQL